MTKQTFLQGTLILIAAGMVTRFMGFINRIVVARIMGEEGVGLYMMAVPTLILAITLTQFGLPVAISKMVAEAEAKSDLKKVKMILIMSLVITGMLSVIFTTLMILFAPWVATNLLTDERTAVPLVVIAPIIPIVAISAVIRGYFQGRQNMKPQAYSQVIEQFVRIISVAFLTKLMLPYGVEYAAAGAMVSVILGEFVSLMYMLRMFSIKKRFKVRKRFLVYLQNGRSTLRELLSIAVPTTGSRMIGSVSFFLEPILVAQSLALAGITATLATKQYGELTGYVLPLLLLPTFITHSLSVALVPSISEAEANKNNKLVHYRIHQSIRLSFASGGLATIVLTTFAATILQLMYGTSHAAYMLALMAPFFLMHYIQSPLQAALQALNFARAAMWNSLIGAVVKFAVLIGLASQPSFGIQGVAIAIVTGVLVVTLLHLATLMKAIGFTIPWADIMKMLILVAATWFMGAQLKSLIHFEIGESMGFALICGLLTIIYIILLFILRFITKEELKQLPFLKKFVK
ncbi:stage V sporulation protein B [Thalassobacillus hwangdonensis]|uniref:Stage V sporulation protein B n=1 Tax=Thalassobacillus hwangdonensis TaxID=546108 RepID=A0ABW3KYA9_9BACI